MDLNSNSNTGEGAQAVATPTNKSVTWRPLILFVSIFLYRIELARSEQQRYMSELSFSVPGTSVTSLWAELCSRQGLSYEWCFLDVQEIVKYGLEKQCLHSKSKVLMQFWCAGAQ